MCQSFPTNNNTTFIISHLSQFKSKAADTGLLLDPGVRGKEAYTYFVADG